MKTLALGIEHKPVEERDEASPTGWVEVKHGRSRGVLLTPEAIDPGRSYPLFTLFHGAGRMEEFFIRTCEEKPEQREALFFIPVSVGPTWDLITDDEAQPDVAFLRYAWDLIYRRYPIDPQRQALIGFSDGASYALSIGLSNPGYFDALLCWAAGFVVVDRNAFDPDAAKPSVYIEYGTHDQLFDFESVALTMKGDHERAGCDVTFSVDEGGRHMPSGHFLDEALDWYFDRWKAD